MKKDFVKSLQLIKFSLSKRTNIVMMILFFLLGLVLEILESAGAIQTNDGYFPVGFGAIFLLSTALFPSQMVVSVDVCSLAQVSPYKKKLQTSMFAVLLLISSLFVFTLILAIRCAGIALRPQASMEELDILPAGMFAAFIILYAGVVYKFFVLSVVLLWAGMTVIGGVCGYMCAIGQSITFLEGFGSPAVSIVLSYLLIVAAAGLGYLLSVALYRFPLSKYALRCSRSVG